MDQCDFIVNEESLKIISGAMYSMMLPDKSAFSNSIVPSLAIFSIKEEINAIGMFSKKDDTMKSVDSMRNHLLIIVPISVLSFFQSF